jgi:hypothetical protein
MYSYEIEKLIKLRNGLVTLKEYIEICNSPQVDHIKYENEEFTIWTTDKYVFKLKIRRN